MLASCMALYGDFHLVPQNATWRYLDNGSDQGTYWLDLDYNDSWWAEGEAELGYGDAAEGYVERTQVGYGSDANSKYITTYFRTYFTVTNLPFITNVVMNLLRDDGAIAYLNGMEVFRSNMPEDPVNSSTYALTAIPAPDEHLFHKKELNPSLLVPGTNILAVEVHQFSRNSPDLSFALQLTAITDGSPPTEREPRVVRGPYLQLATKESITIRWRTDIATNSVVAITNSTDLKENYLIKVEGSRVDHEVQVPNLKPNTKYLYQIGMGSGPLFVAGEMSFTTFPEEAKPSRIWVIGDSGTATTDARRVYESYSNYTGEVATDLWLMLGDNAYGTGTDSQYQQAVFQMYPELLRTVAVWPTLGNHDTIARDPNGVYPYLNIFTLPTGGEAGGVPSGTERYYSFDFGNIHFICLDSEVSSRNITGEMAQWLESDLAANTKPWTIAYWHSPPYTKGSHDSDNPNDSGGRLVQMRENILPILEAYNVDLVLCGHSHIYERSYLLNGHYGYSSTLTPEMIKDSGSGRLDDGGAYIKDNNAQIGAVYVVAGSSGHATWRTGHHPVMFADLLEMGSLILDINSNRLDATFLRLDGVIRDYFTVLKAPGDSTLKITRFVVNEPTITGSWRSVAGKNYQVERTLQLLNPLWEPVGLPITASGVTTSWTNTVDAGAGYYRVRQLK